jgi:tetratricopeptide (TPR) repeat protein
MLSLLIMALDNTEGTSPERLKAAAQVGRLASWTSEFELGHKWTAFVIANTEEADGYHQRALISKGFLYFEQREYGPAREHLIRVIDIVTRLGQESLRIAAIANLAGVQWQELEFGEAIEAYQGILDAVQANPDPSFAWFASAIHANLAFVFAVMGNWPEAIEHGRTCIATSEGHPLYGLVCATPLGLSLFANGEKRQGLQELLRAVDATSRQGLVRYNQMAIDFAAAALSRNNARDVARSVADANAEHRFALRHVRSPAENKLLLDAGAITSTSDRLASNPLRGQSAATLSQWVCEELERALARLA